MLSRRLALIGLLGVTLLPGSLALGTAHAAETLKEFRVGYQKGAAILVIAKQRAVFETRLKELGVDTVTWVEFQFGPPLLEALGAGAVDIGLVGDTPPIFAQAAKANLVYVASEPAAANYILVPKDSTIQSVAELKGKKVAIAKGSSSQNLTIQALVSNGLAFSEIEPVYLAPADAAAAFATGQVDAWTIWDPYLAIAETKHGGRPIAKSDEPELASSSFYLANGEFAKSHPDVLQAVLEEIGGIAKWADENRGELAQISSDVTGVDIEATTIAANRWEIALRPITAENIAKQQRIADTFAELGLIPAPIKVSDIVWSVPTN